MRTEKRNLKKNPDIILGSSSNKYYLEREVINLSKIKVVVLDEADEMLNLGFSKRIRIYSKSNSKRKKDFIIFCYDIKGNRKACF